MLGMVEELGRAEARALAVETSSIHEELLPRTVTPRPFPAYEADTLRTWFNVTDGAPWTMAWNTAEASPTAVHYDPQVHLNAYLIRCRDQSQRPRADLWLRWFIEDREKYARSLAADEERQARSELDPQAREERDNRRLPPADWGTPPEDGLA